MVFLDDDPHERRRLTYEDRDTISIIVNVKRVTEHYHLNVKFLFHLFLP